MTEFDKVIPPGGVGNVIASLDTSHYRGPVSKSVMVTTNDPRMRQVRLEIRAEIVAAVDVLPSDAPTLLMVVGEPKPIELTVTAADGTRFDILGVEADPVVKVTVRPAPGTPAASRAAKDSPRVPVASGGSRYLVTIAPSKDLPVGRRAANVTLTTSHPKAPTVPIRAVVVVAARAGGEGARVRPGVR